MILQIHRSDRIFIDQIESSLRLHWSYSHRHQTLIHLSGGKIPKYQTNPIEIYPELENTLFEIHFWKIHFKKYQLICQLARIQNIGQIQLKYIPNQTNLVRGSNVKKWGRISRDRFVGLKLCKAFHSTASGRMIRVENWEIQTKRT